MQISYSLVGSVPISEDGTPMPVTPGELTPEEVRTFLMSGTETVNGDGADNTRTRLVTVDSNGAIITVSPAAESRTSQTLSYIVEVLIDIKNILAGMAGG